MGVRPETPPGLTPEKRKKTLGGLCLKRTGNRPKIDGQKKKRARHLSDKPTKAVFKPLLGGGKRGVRVFGRSGGGLGTNPKPLRKRPKPKSAKGSRKRIEDTGKGS